MPHGNKVISSRDVRIDEMSHFSWKDVRDSEIVPAFEDSFVSIEHGNPVHRLIEDVMEEPTITHPKIDKHANMKIILYQNPKILIMLIIMRETYQHPDLHQKTLMKIQTPQES